MAYLDKARMVFARVDDVWDALIWRIVRDPECGFFLVGSNPARYVVRSKLPATFPKMRLVYVYEPARWQIKVLKLQVSR